MIDAGSLKFEVTIQQLTEGVDTGGAPKEDWTTLITAWMARETERGVETFGGVQVVAGLVTKWTMRYVASMDPDVLGSDGLPQDIPRIRRLRYQGRPYDIQHVEMIGRKDGIILRTIARQG